MRIQPRRGIRLSRRSAVAANLRPWRALRQRRAAAEALHRPDDVLDWSRSEVQVGGGHVSSGALAGSPLELPLRESCSELCEVRVAARVHTRPKLKHQHRAIKKWLESHRLVVVADVGALPFPRCSSTGTFRRRPSARRQLLDGDQVRRRLPSLPSSLLLL